MGVKVKVNRAGWLIILRTGNCTNDDTTWSSSCASLNCCMMKVGGAVVCCARATTTGGVTSELLDCSVLWRDDVILRLKPLNSPLRRRLSPCDMRSLRVYFFFIDAARWIELSMSSCPPSRRWLLWSRMRCICSCVLSRQVTSQNMQLKVTWFQLPAERSEGISPADSVIKKEFELLAIQRIAILFTI